MLEGWGEGKIGGNGFAVAPGTGEIMVKMESDDRRTGTAGSGPGRMGQGRDLGTSPQCD